MLNQTFNRIVSEKGTPRPNARELRNDYYCSLAELKDVVRSIELLDIIENQILKCRKIKDFLILAVALPYYLPRL